ncbi:hypothetical protein DNFV4_01894 [Nitrospira tepida]|uniref:DUF3332 domain-containing protein n=1 Tax=Nitrospira tepida TaxID=2973512 RepID=A0AA86MYW8_9BACT|nr:DUF3332 family protein [Nitrospira tepida]CAI4031472.1 hypothetical protein DNFV4_01894 [Nitrospira tepida]
MKLFGPHRSIVSGMVLAALLATTSACYGPFNLTRSVYKWNGNVKGSGEVNEKWMKEIIFLALVIIPVYQLSTLADAFIFNSVEFWTGQNPVKVSQSSPSNGTKTVRVGDLRTEVVLVSDGPSKRVEYRRDGLVVKTGRVIEEGGRLKLVDQNGQELFSAEVSREGQVMILDGDCRPVETLSPEQVKVLGQQAEKL